MNAEELRKLYEPKPADAEITYERQLWQARYSPDGRLIVGCGYDATVQRWNLTEEKPVQLAPLTAHNGWVQCMEFLPGGTDAQTKLFTADSWGQLICWPVAEESPQPVWKQETAHDGWIRALAVSPDGKLVATGGNDLTVRLWSTADGSPQGELPHPERVFSLTFHPTDGSLVSGDLKGSIRQWDVAGKKVVRTLDAGLLYQLSKIQECGGVRHLAFDAAGGQLACAGQKAPQGGFATGTP
ncbi:MAG: hypothetical protein KDA79_12950, partial [Planctomycetaceae bacterium]|nr:hypothetical protein [Planctomycetaceae bacterium]